MDIKLSTIPFYSSECEQGVEAQNACHDSFNWGSAANGGGHLPWSIPHTAIGEGIWYIIFISLPQKKYLGNAQTFHVCAYLVMLFNIKKMRASETQNSTKLDDTRYKQQWLPISSLQTLSQKCHVSVSRIV